MVLTQSASDFRPFWTLRPKLKDIAYFNPIIHHLKYAAVKISLIEFHNPAIPNNLSHGFWDNSPALPGKGYSFCD